jgi:hypothetical protein
MGEVRRKGRETDYRKFGIGYVVGVKVCHLHVDGKIKTQCGLYRLGLKVTPDSGPPICKNCRKTIRVVKELGKRVAVFRASGAVVSIVEGNGQTFLHG